MGVQDITVDVFWPEGFDEQIAKKVNRHQALVFVATVPTQQVDNPLMTALQELQVKQIQGFVTRSSQLFGSVVVHTDENIEKIPYEGAVHEFHYPWIKDPKKASFKGYGGP